MGSSSFHGTPCLVPAELTLNDGETRRGFITRLSPTAAAVSSDPALLVGSQIVVTFKRPSDSARMQARAGVREHLSEGGLWRGQPAALVTFHSPVELEEGEAVATVAPTPGPPAGNAAPRTGETSLDEPGRSDEFLSEPPPARDDDEEVVTQDQPAVPTFGTAVRAKKGLGKRKLAGRLRQRAGSPFERREEDRTQPSAHRPTPAPQPAERPSEDLESAFFDDDGDTLPPSKIKPLEEATATVPPAAADVDPFFSEPTPDLAADDDSSILGSAEEIGGGDNSSFIAHFGGADAGYGFDSAGDISSESRPSFISEPGTLPPENISPASVPGSPVPQPTGGQQSKHPRRRKTDVGRQMYSRPPWEIDGTTSAREDSLIPRNARIASQVEVTFWARGLRNPAMADNFSREGLFLKYPGVPPVRGAIVRIEFPVHGADESVSIRFNAEVRWHRDDRPGVGLPDGFGVQILTFETPKDRGRYAELLDAILALGPGPSPVEGFAWGRPGN